MPSPTTRTCATSRIFSLIRCKSSLILGPRGPRGNGGRGPPGFGAPGFGRLKNGAAMLTSGFKLVLLYLRLIIYDLRNNHSVYTPLTIGNGEVTLSD